MKKIIDIPKDVKERLEKLAKKESRSLKNFIESKLEEISKSK